MQQFTLKIRLGNDAMQTAEDVARALHSVANLVENSITSGLILDDNGNSVGNYTLR